MPTGAKSGGGGAGGAGAGAVRAGRAFIELFGDDTKLARTLSKVKNNLRDFGQFIGKIGLGLGAAGAGLLAPLTALLKSGADRADQIGDIADVFGLTAESASKMASAFEMAGSTIEDMQVALGKLAASNKTGIPLDDYFFSVADSINAIDDASERFQKAKEIFGDKFAFKFLDASGDVSGFVKNAPGLSAEEIKRAKELNVELTRTGIVMKSALLPLLDVITPVVAAIADFARENAGLLRVAFKAGLQLVALGAAFYALSSAVSAVGSVIGGVSSLFGFLLSPMGLITIGIAGIVAVVALSIRSFETWEAEATAAFGGIAEAAVTSWAGISDALRAGDLALAASIAFAGIKVAWAEVVLFMTKAWVDFKGHFVDATYDAAMLSLLAWNDFTKAFDKMIENVADAFVQAFIHAIRSVAVAGMSLSKAVGLDETSATIGEFVGMLDRADKIREDIHQRELKRINKEANLKAKAIHQAAGELQDERNAARAAEVADAANDLARAREELNRLRAEAAAKLLKPFSFGAFGSGGASGAGSAFKQLQLQADEVRGGFAGRSTANEFAFGKVRADKTADVARNTAVLPEIDKKMANLIDAVEKQVVVG